jgi:hypothetical protein
MMRKFLYFLIVPVLIPFILPFGLLLGLAIYEARQTHINTEPIPHIFHIGEEVYYKLDNRKGIIVDYEPYYYDKRRYETVTYSVKFAVDKSLGIDTAAGHGMLGDSDHYEPTLYPTIKCKEFELKKLK